MGEGVVTQFASDVSGNGSLQQKQGSRVALGSVCVFICCLCLEMETRDMFFYRLLPPFQNNAHSAGDDEVV